MSEVVFDRVSKSFGPVKAVSDFNLSIEKGNLVVLLGPSGCGKTTSLQMLGGFLHPSSGRLLLQGKDVTNVPPHKRDTSMVFQSYALFPHLTVFENVAYGLRRRGLRGAELESRVLEALDLVRIRDLQKRYPKELSGGQQQRVAVARSVVLKPAVLLLDEPFSALDAQVREATRVELRRIQQQTGITAMLVTHDQQEAMSIADQVVVMNEGEIEQAGSPLEIYDAPSTRFVAEFVGAANVFEGAMEGSVFKTTTGVVIEVEAPATGDAPTLAVVRGEDISVERANGATAPAANTVGGRISVASFLGNSAKLSVELGNGSEIVVRSDRILASKFGAGDDVVLSWKSGDVRLLAR